MESTSADAIICGAGISGIAAAYHLAVRQRVGRVLLVDERAPMTLTSDKSTECYRNWWPDAAMLAFMNRSIDLLEKLARESANTFGLNRRGYVFLTSKQKMEQRYRRSAETICALGAGELRIHTGDDSSYQRSPAQGFEGQPSGADLLLGADLIQRHYPFITSSARALLHTRRCGWLSAQQLGAYLMEKAKASGMEFVRGQVVGVSTKKGRVTDVTIRQDGRDTQIETRALVNCAGPYLKETGRLVGVDLPVYNELHGKVALHDTLGVVPRDVPLMLWDDPVQLPWTEAERTELAADPKTHWVTEELPSGVHFKPEGGEDSPVLLALWTYDIKPQEPVWPPTFPAEYAEVVLRGLTQMVPGLEAYIGKMHNPAVDGGYYCKTKENRPLIGPLPVDGAYVFGAVSGYGIMAAMAGGELLAAHVAGSALPPYAEAFLPSRYEDAEYQRELAETGARSGQL